MTRRPLIALLTDFGTNDHYVGVMKGVMRGICPDIDFIDITHNIPPQNITAGAFALMNAYEYFPARTIFLVVIDPGVGTQRRPILIHTPRYGFVAPDNGVLSYALNGQHITSSHEIITEHSLANVKKNLSMTFHGRDIFAPVAARSACGYITLPSDIDYLKPITSASLQHLPHPKISLDGNQLMGHVIYIDHFGNIITSIGTLNWKPSHHHLIFNPQFDRTLPQLIIPNTSKVTIGDHQINGINHTYGEKSSGELLALVGSNHYLEIAVNGGSAAHTLDIQPGTPVTIHITEEN